MKTCKSSVSLSGDMTPTSKLLPALKRGQWLRAGDKGAPPSGVRGSFSEARSHSLSQETSFCSEPRPFLGSDASPRVCEFQDPGGRSRLVCFSEHTGFSSCADSNYVVTRLRFGLCLRGVKSLENSEWW